MHVGPSGASTCEAIGEPASCAAWLFGSQLHGPAGGAPVFECSSREAWPDGRALYAARVGATAGFARFPAWAARFPAWALARRCAAGVFVPMSAPLCAGVARATVVWVELEELPPHPATRAATR